MATSALKVCISANVSKDSREFIEQVLVFEDIVWLAPAQGGWPENPPNAFASCDICFGNVPGKWLLSANNLRWIQLAATGVDEYLSIASDVHDKNLVITNLRGMFAIPCAETAIAGLLSLTRGIAALVSVLSKRKWIGGDIRPQLRTLDGANVLICGAGAIGTRIRVLLRALGCICVTYAKSSAGAELHGPAQLNDYLPAMDIVVSCLPGTPETSNLFNRDRLGLLKETAYFVNIGRGSVVDEAALCDALEEGALAGAVLDVTIEEPLPIGSRLWTAPNTLLLQHSAGGSGSEDAEKVKIFVDNYRRYRNGDPLLNIVNLHRGY